MSVEVVEYRCCFIHTPGEGICVRFKRTEFVDGKVENTLGMELVHEASQAAAMAQARDVLRFIEGDDERAEWVAALDDLEQRTWR